LGKAREKMFFPQHLPEKRSAEKAELLLASTEISKNKQHKKKGISN